MRNTAYLMAGAGGSKLLLLAVMPLLTRIYDPSDFGMLSVFSSCALILIPVSTLRYSVAIPLPRRERAAINLLMVCFLSVALFSGLSFGFLRFAGDDLFALLNMPTLAKYDWLLALCVMGAGFYDVMSFWCTRTKKFGEVAKAQMWQTILGSVAKVILGLVGLKPVGLLIGQVLQFAGGAMYLFRISKVARPGIGSLVSLERMRFVAKRYVNFPRFRLPSQLILAVSAQAPILAFASLYGSDEAGHLGLAFAAVGIPMTLLAQTISNAYYGEISGYGQSKSRQVLAVSKTVLLATAAIVSVPTSLVVIFAPEIFHLAFGSEWSRAGQYAGALALAGGLQIIATPLLQIYNLFERHLAFLFLNVLRLVLVFAVFVAVWMGSLSPAVFVWTYVSALALFYLVVVLTSMSYLARLEEKGVE